MRPTRGSRHHDRFLRGSAPRRNIVTMDENATLGIAPSPRVDADGASSTLAPVHRRLVFRVEALAANATGADKSWVHGAHAAALRHLGSATKSRI